MSAGSFGILRYGVSGVLRSGLAGIVVWELLRCGTELEVGCCMDLVCAMM